MAFIDRYKVRPDGTGSFFNYYSGMPDYDPTFEKPPEEEPVDPVDTDPSLRPMRVEDSGGESETEMYETRASIDGVSGIQEVNFGDIKYNTFNDYLDTTEYKLDKSGMYSKIDMPRDATAKNFGRASNLAGATFMNPGLILGGFIAQQFDTRTFQSPLGQDRFIQTTGIGNVVGLQNIETEYKDLNQIKQDKLSNITTDPAFDYLNFDYGYGIDPNIMVDVVGGPPQQAKIIEGQIQEQYTKGITQDKQDFAIGKKADFTNIGYGVAAKKDTGFAIKVGDGTVYRKKGEMLYKGLPTGVTQNVAKTVEALLSNQNPREFNPDGGDISALASKTKDGSLLGGYTLDGKGIMMNGGIAMMGSMKQFEAMAATNFQFGNLTVKEAQGFARGWMEGARGKNFKSQAEKLEHLNRFQELARKSGGVLGKTVKTKTNILNFAKKNFPNAKNKSSRGQDDRTVANIEKKEEQFKRQTAAFSSPEQSKEAATRGGDYGVGSATYSNFGTVSDDGGDDGGFDSGGVGQGGDSYGGLDFAEGGRVEMAMGSGEEEIVLDDNRVEPIIKDDSDMIISGNELLADEKTQKSGFVNKPASQTSDQEGIADTTPIQLRNDQNPEGATIVMNKPSIDLMGEKNFMKMVKDGLRYLRSKGKALSENDDEYIKKNFTDVAISSGEAVVQPELANVIGRKRLLALNERGKRRVSKAKRQSASEGGFIKKKFGDEVNEQGFLVEPVDPKVMKLFKTLNKRPSFQRKNVENLINNFSDQQALAMLIFAESYLSSDSMVELEAIGETVINRMNDKTYSFKNINTIKDVLKQRSKRGKGSKMFMYDGLEPKNLKPRLKEMMRSDYWTKAMAAAENVLTMGGGEPDYQRHLRNDVFTYGRVGKAADSLANNLRNEEYLTLGNHTFFSRVPEKGGRLSLEEMGMPASFYRGEKPRSSYFGDN